MMSYYQLYETEEYFEWFEEETLKSQRQILKRLTHITEEGYFGRMRDLDRDLCELKFNDGRRIYYTIIPESLMVLLLGGNKNGQDKDIKKARSLLEKAQEASDS